MPVTPEHNQQNIIIIIEQPRQYTGDGNHPPPHPPARAGQHGKIIIKIWSEQIYKKTNLNELALRMSSLSCIAYAGSSIATSRCQLPTCQTHRKTEFRLWLCGCANPSRDLAVTHSLSPSLITELSLDSSISDIAYSPHIRANALPSSTGALSSCSNSSDVINLLV